MRVKPPEVPVSLEQHSIAHESAKYRPGKCRLFGFLNRLEMGLESLAILVLGFEFGLQFLDHELEAANFIAQLLNNR